MKKEVNLCDICKTTVSIRKCDICNIDLCEHDVSGVSKLLVGSNSFGVLYFCADCRKKFSSIKRNQNKSAQSEETLEAVGFYDTEFKNRVFKEIKSYIKERVVAEAL